MKSIIAMCVAALIGVSFAAQAAGDSTFGKRVTSTKEVAKSRAGSFDVFIDKSTGFVFVNTPEGWKFIRQLKDDAASKVVVSMAS